MSVKESKLKAVESEIARERAESLGRGAQRLRSSLDNLRQLDAGEPTHKSREQLVFEASTACLAYVVQREIMGFGAQDAQAIRTDFAVPGEVWDRMGAIRQE
jgi:uncharacterized protein DUF6665